MMVSLCNLFIVRQCVSASLPCTFLTRLACVVLLSLDGGKHAQFKQNAKPESDYQSLQNTRTLLQHSNNS